MHISFFKVSELKIKIDKVNINRTKKEATFLKSIIRRNETYSSKRIKGVLSPDKTIIIDDIKILKKNK